MLKLRHPVSLLAIGLLVMLGVLRTYSTPSPVESDAPDVVFSAVRAEAILRDLLQENLPHVAGSPQNAVVRDRVLAHLEKYGYEPRIQSVFHCNPAFGSCSQVDNIVAVKSGSVGGDAVLLTAHYDSGWAGPGASDDGVAVAALLEIARMAQDFPPFINDVIFLLSDSEENGLIGAHAFATQDPLFDRVMAVINLEARGATGPSVMFETGEGNRRIIRMFAGSVERPVANSLVYEMYKRMPNDTDYSVYRDLGVMGLNFAFAEGVAAYHSRIDDIDHIDLGSLQHHGDNAWAMIKALGERKRLSSVVSKEDAGFIDLFALRLVHYPVSVTGGLALFLGVWVMIAIGLAFRKEFRYRQLRWGLLAVPFLILLIPLAGYFLSWPLGHWPDLHPLEHPYPWAGRIALLLATLLCLYVTIKLFLGRVSPCAWMILGWFLIFLLAMLLADRLPTASHIALIPLAMFALGSLADLVRKKSPAPLLIASVAGFAATVFIAFYHFFMLDAVMNFDGSHFKIAMLCIAAITAMPMLLAFASKRELDWRPAAWLVLAVVLSLVVHLFLPAYTPERPRDMTLMYREVEGASDGYLVLESIYKRHDRSYARSNGFEPTELNSGRLDTVERPARKVSAMGLPAIRILDETARLSEGSWIRGFRMEPPGPVPLLTLTVPQEAGLRRAWVNGVLALDATLETKRGKTPNTLRLIYPGAGPIRVELDTAEAGRLELAAVTWHQLPSVLVAPFMGTWPDEAKPFYYGPRAELVQEFELPAATALQAAQELN
jgi:hypothetical protein